MACCRIPATFEDPSVRPSCPAPRPTTSLPALTVALFGAVLVAACGGGGGDSTAASPAPAPAPVPAPSPVPEVSSIAIGTPKYSQAVQFTLTGTRLTEATLAVTSPACKAAPTLVGTVSATSAVYSCTIGSVGASTVTAANGTTTLNTLAYTVPAPQVRLTVSNGLAAVGDIVVELDPTRTPVTTDNFLQYVNDGFYTGTVFHRSVAGFVVQGGGYTAVRPTLQPKATRPAIALEVGKGLTNQQWTIAMARAAGNDTATAQFFFNLVDNAFLDPGTSTAGYAVFGRIVAGTSVVSAIVAAPCAAITGLSECAPNPDVVITASSQMQ